ncbi:DUF3800 domain-containing protein [Rubricoccus marinus]|uniref:DUF3800 domain-containing protein n=1 Tax=Rubricoccus marinus TaxID=716817 RepID=UPI0026783B8B
MLEQRAADRKPFPRDKQKSTNESQLEEWSLGPSHYGFIDESCLTAERHGAIALVSMRLGAFGKVREAFHDPFESWPSSREAKFEYVRGEAKAQAASRILLRAFELADQGLIRVDILHWDTQDRYHSVYERDDAQNANNRARNLIRRVCVDRWIDARSWVLYPDKGSIVDWASCAERLQLGQRLGQAKRFQIRESESGDHNLVQVADLFAGAAAFSANRPSSLWGERNDSPRLSGGDRYKRQVVERLLEELEPRGVRRTEGRGLSTLRTHKDAAINFWPFRTPSGLGYAPRRNSQSGIRTP